MAWPLPFSLPGILPAVGRRSEVPAIGRKGKEPLPASQGIRPGMGVRTRGRLVEEPVVRGYGTSRLGIFHPLSLPAKNLRQGSGGSGGFLVVAPGRNQAHDGAPPLRPPTPVRASRASPGRAYASSLLVLQGPGKRNGSQRRRISFSLPMEFHSRDLAPLDHCGTCGKPASYGLLTSEGLTCGLASGMSPGRVALSRRNGIESLEKGCYALRQGISGRTLRRGWRSPLSKGFCIVPEAARRQRLDFGRWKS